jgi:hypothetical protein
VRASAGVSVNATGLISHHMAVFKFNNSAAHLVNDLGVMG